MLYRLIWKSTLTRSRDPDIDRSSCVSKAFSVHLVRLLLLSWEELMLHHQRCAQEGMRLWSCIPLFLRNTVPPYHSAASVPIHFNRYSIKRPITSWGIHLRSLYLHSCRSTCSYAFNKHLIKEILFIMFSVYNISMICKENKPDVCHVLVIDFGYGG